MDNQIVSLNRSIILSSWREYFWEVHQLRANFDGIIIPEADDNDFPWLVCRPERFFPERACNGGKQLYDKLIWTHESLDDVIDMSFGRDGWEHSYIARFHPNWEADEELKNLSADQITEKKINTACLTERLLLGDFLFWKYKKQLDRSKLIETSCLASRYSDGGVPVVDWYDGKLRVYSYDAGVCDDKLRSRKVITA